jgi:TolB-like protein
MPQSPNKITQFWQELKRRKVVRVITVYAAAAFVILELVDIIAEPLKLPSWLLPVVIVLLSIGFLIAIILSWIYDIHPEGGMVKTEPADKIKAKDFPKSSNTWRIASYISFVVIIALIVLNIVPRANNNKEILDKSIAVLPFINDSPDEENAYFINGTMEAILDNLCKIEDIRVVGRTSVEQYRNAPKPIPVIADEMNVSYILEGSGQKDGNKVRLTLQLIDGINDKHLWSSPYIREIEIGQIFDLQSEIAQLVAVEIEAIITPEEKQLIEKIPTTSLTAYDLYKKGRDEYNQYWLDRDNRTALERAEKLYQNALDYDSTFAQAYTGLAYVYWEKHYWESYFSENFLDSVLILADIALSFDPQLSDAYTIRGIYYSDYGQNEKAIIEYEKAIKLNPNDWIAYFRIGVTYRDNSDNVKAIDNYHNAISLYRGPLLSIIFERLAWSYVEVGFQEKAQFYQHEAYLLNGDSISYFYTLARTENYLVNENEYGNSLKLIYLMDTTRNGILLQLGYEYGYEGKYEESLKYLKKYYERLEGLGSYKIVDMHRLGYAYWENGFYTEADYYFDTMIEYYNELIQLGRKDLTTNYNIAGVYAYRGEKDRAYENLRLFNEMERIPSWWLDLFRIDPLFNSLRDEPEFKQILRDNEDKYQKEHERVRKWLEENDML